MGGWIAFGVAGLGTLLSAAMVVRTKDLVHGVLWLALTLLGTSALYAVLDAGFLAAIQVLLYTGGVITLMLFAVLLARRDPGAIPSGGSEGQGVAALLSLAVFAVVATGVLRTQDLPQTQGAGTSIQRLGELMLTELLLPFEAVSVLLLAAMIGAIVLARKADA